MRMLEPHGITRCHVLKFPLKFPSKWCGELSFGVFYDVVLLLLEIREKSSIDGQVKVINKIMVGVMNFFWKMMKASLVELKGNCLLASFPIGIEENNCISFFELESNFKRVVKEWALLSILRGDRNSYTHPFPTSSHKEVSKYRLQFVEFLRDTLETKYYEPFLHVSMLALISIEAHGAAVPN